MKPFPPVRQAAMLAGLAILALAGCKPAAEPDAAAVAAASGAYKTCAGCHGAEGEGNAALKAPALVNLDGDYMARQLRHFRDGKRGANPADTQGAIMAASAAALNDAAIGAIVSQVAGFPDILPAPTFEADIANGRDYYNMVCGACHGPDAVGNEALGAPSLRGIDDAYLARQYELFRDGLRGDHPDDEPGQQMRRMGQVLKDEDAIRNVSAYLLSLGLPD
ncbi:c-type cytochrome [Marinihelvus fidelis]|uniref:c-type cytochrome n=1 Tax=Marinihelvus fidelis TaxID=2613842 RepID=UPI001CD514DA|nr:c-type cytochrome [Marinihelvus fidelis]